jgi:hypothetical protein
MRGDLAARKRVSRRACACAWTTRSVISKVAREVEAGAIDRVRRDAQATSIPSVLSKLFFTGKQPAAKAGFGEACGKQKCTLTAVAP